MANTLLRDRARVLRTRGSSLNEITLLLGIPKSTVRFWCRDIGLSDKQLQRLSVKQKLGGMRAAEKIRQNRINLTKKLILDGKREVGNLSSRDLWIAGTALYWAEGYRKGNGEFGFTNSNPTMITLLIKWLQKICKIPREDIRLRICVNDMHKGRIDAIKKFWSITTGLPTSQFSKPTFIKTKNKKVYLEPIQHFGTLRIKVRKSTNLKRKILGWIEGLSSA